MFQYIEGDNRCKPFVFEKILTFLYIAGPDKCALFHSFLCLGNCMVVRVKRPDAAVCGEGRSKIPDAAAYFQDIATHVFRKFPKRPAVVPHGLVHTLECR